MYHVLIRDEQDAMLYRRILPAEAHRVVVCEDGDLYRVINDPAPNVCTFGPDGERLCDFDQPHEHR